MKTLLKSILVCLCLLSAHRAHALGGCSEWWNPDNVLYFGQGGAVLVVYPDGSAYSVSGPVQGNPTNSYPLVDHALVYFFPHNCGNWTVADDFFGVCNNQGGLDVGPPTTKGCAGVNYIVWTVHIDCNCPNGTSTHSWQLYDVSYCQAPPPPPQ